MLKLAFVIVLIVLLVIAIFILTAELKRSHGMLKEAIRFEKALWLVLTIDEENKKKSPFAKMAAVKKFKTEYAPLKTHFSQKPSEFVHRYPFIPDVVDYMKPYGY
jgi:hypothetical protein